MGVEEKVDHTDAQTAAPTGAFIPAAGRPGAMSSPRPS